MRAWGTSLNSNCAAIKFPLRCGARLRSTRLPCPPKAWAGATTYTRQRRQCSDAVRKYPIRSFVETTSGYGSRLMPRKSFGGRGGRLENGRECTPGTMRSNAVEFNSGRWISCNIRGAIGHGARNGVHPLPVNSDASTMCVARIRDRRRISGVPSTYLSTPRGGSRSAVLRVLTCENRKWNHVAGVQCGLFVDGLMAVSSLFRKLARRGVKPTSSLLCSPFICQDAGEYFSKVFEIVLHDVLIITHGGVSVVPFPQTVVQ